MVTPLLITRDGLLRRMAIIVQDARMKLEVGDYHGCADACMDLREIEAQIKVIDQLRERQQQGTQG